MQNHVELAISSNVLDLLYWKTIQNELIILMAKQVNSAIIQRSLTAMYLAMIADCTSGVSYREEFSLNIRFVDISRNISKIKEHF